MAAQSPILDLTTDRKRLTVRLDSGERQIRSPYDLTVEEFQKLERLLPRLGELLLKPERTPAEAKERQQVTGTLCAIALGMGPDGLSDLHQTLITDLFIDLCSPIVTSLQRARGSLGATTTTPVGNGSSLVSSASTTSRRKSGSPKPRSG